MKKQLLNFFNLSIVNIFIRLSGLLVFPVIAKKFSIEIFGVYVLAQTVWTYFSTFSDMGVKRIAIRDLNQLNSEGDRDNYKENVVNLRVITCAVSVILMNILGFILIRDSQTRLLIHIFSLSILPLALDITWIFDAHQDMSKQIRYRLIERILFLTIVFLGATLRNIVFVACAGMISHSIAGGILLFQHKENIHYFKFKFRKKQVEIFRESFILGISALLTPLILTIDLLFVNYFLSKEYVAIYGGYEKLITAIISFGWVLAYAVYPELARLYGRHEISKIWHLFIKITFFVVGVFIPGAILYFFLSKWLILNIFTIDFLKGINALHILIFVSLPSVLNSLFLSGLNAFGMTKTRLYITIIGLIFNASLCLMLVPRFRIVGAALASLLTHFLITIASIIIIRITLCRSKIDNNIRGDDNEAIIPEMA